MAGINKRLIERRHIDEPFSRMKGDSMSINLIKVFKKFTSVDVPINLGYVTNKGIYEYTNLINIKDLLKDVQCILKSNIKVFPDILTKGNCTSLAVDSTGNLVGQRVGFYDIINSIFSYKMGNFSNKKLQGSCGSTLYNLLYSEMKGYTLIVKGLSKEFFEYDLNDVEGSVFISVYYRYEKESENLDGFFIVIDLS